ncbi:YceD family protein [Hymenobacter actinosclerus]|uniref:Uncharacterized metal-binding protein YceD, DUF177 family n=1 Tax=Hymenobacter actinosclerus TaxID=82805 RepID=A0A1I0EWP9_9BACT|nr:DUF177 domain-containing protein [Hymenobacter actinosclerus]SET49335.1 Uncharacterized metal-binding protein YceD, DUF177 family [Hymenobacter actinosclerus]
MLLPPVKKDSPYNINLARLADKTHHFAFDLDQAFFEQFDQDLIPDGNVHVDVTLHKTERLITVDFDLKGTVRQVCDRSLDDYDQDVAAHEQLLVRFGDEEKELDDNVLQITPETQTLPLAQHLFDFVGLALPMKKLHPRFQNEPDDEPDAKTKLIFTTRGEDADDDEDESDPRWNALRNLN